MTRDAVGGVMGCPRDRLRAVSATGDPDGEKSKKTGPVSSFPRCAGK